jgi:glycosyltransferase involved in cell wall biosynthesis
MIENGEKGLVAKNFEEFVQFSVELMDNPEKMSKMKRLAREIVISRFWDTVFEKVYEAYIETLKIAKGKKITTAKQN